MRNINQLFNECMAEVKKLGIQPGNIVSVKANSRAKSRWGQTQKNNGYYSININSELLKDNIDIKAVKNTMIHEILHTCDGCMNHGELWKTYAGMVNSAYGYNIKRCTSAEEKGLSGLQMHKEEHKYILVCQNCNEKYYYKRAGKAVQNYTRFRCGKCHSKLNLEYI